MAASKNRIFDMGVALLEQTHRLLPCNLRAKFLAGGSSEGWKS